MNESPLEQSKRVAMVINDMIKRKREERGLSWDQAFNEESEYYQLELNSDRVYVGACNECLTIQGRGDERTVIAKADITPVRVQHAIEEIQDVLSEISRIEETARGLVEQYKNDLITGKESEGRTLKLLQVIKDHLDDALDDWMTHEIADLDYEELHDEL